jgi:hypothetical protein
MSESDREQEFLNKVRNTLDRSVDELDAATASRITQARHAALESKSGSRVRNVWLPAAAAVAASAAVVAVIATRAPGEAAPMLDDLELIAAPDDPEFYRDLEFYAWLDTHESAG